MAIPSTSASKKSIIFPFQSNKRHLISSLDDDLKDSNSSLGRGGGDDDDNLLKASSSRALTRDDKNGVSDVALSFSTSSQNDRQLLDVDVEPQNPNPPSERYTPTKTNEGGGAFGNALFPDLTHFLSASSGSNSQFKIHSVEHLLELLCPPLTYFGFLNDQPELVNRFCGTEETRKSRAGAGAGTGAGSNNSHREEDRFLRRHLPKLQLLIISRLIIDWKESVDQYGVDGLEITMTDSRAKSSPLTTTKLSKIIFDRFFSPPPLVPSLDDGENAHPQRLRTQIVISSYQVFSSFLSLSTRSNHHHPLSTIYSINHLLPIVSRDYPIQYLFRGLLLSYNSDPSSKPRVKELSEWKSLINTLFSLSIRVENLLGMLKANGLSSSSSSGPSSSSSLLKEEWAEWKGWKYWCHLISWGFLESIWLLSSTPSTSPLTTTTTSSSSSSSSREETKALTYLLAKLIRSGYFSSPSSSESQSFFPTSFQPFLLEKLQQTQQQAQKPFIDNQDRNSKSELELFFNLFQKIWKALPISGLSSSNNNNKGRKAKDRNSGDDALTFLAGLLGWIKGFVYVKDGEEEMDEKVSAAAGSGVKMNQGVDVDGEMMVNLGGWLLLNVIGRLDHDDDEVQVQDQKQKQKQDQDSNGEDKNDDSGSESEDTDNDTEDEELEVEEEEEGHLTSSEIYSLTINKILLSFSSSNGGWDPDPEPEPGIPHLKRDRTMMMARTVVCWTEMGDGEKDERHRRSGGRNGSDEQKGMKSLINSVLEVWGNEDTVTYASEEKHFFLTTLLILIISLLTSPSFRTAPSPTFLKSLSFTSSFINSITVHISSLRPRVRLEGMLVAEFMAWVVHTVEGKDMGGKHGKEKEGAGEKIRVLDFGKEVWEGDEDGRKMIRWLRGVGEGIVTLKDRPEENIDRPDIKDLMEQLKIRLEEISKPKKLGTKLDDSNGLNVIPSSSSSTSTETSSPVQSGQKKQKRPLIEVLDSTASTSTTTPTPDKSSSSSLISPNPNSNPTTPYHLPSPPPTSLIKDLDSPDPSLYQTLYPKTRTQSRKTRPPVYIADLSSMLKGLNVVDKGVTMKGLGGAGADERDDDEEEKAQKVEIGLKEGERLVRKKMGWGKEVEENAIDLTFAVINLQDNYDTQDFEPMRMKLLTALVVACPKLVAPCIIEQLFSQAYSISQRTGMLASLGFASRELANLPSFVEASSSSSPSLTKKIDNNFPSKMLPPALHQKIMSLEQQPSSPSSTVSSDPLQPVLVDLTRNALGAAKTGAEKTIPEAAREKLLTVGGPNKNKRNIVEASSQRKGSGQTKKGNLDAPPFLDLAASYFIMPLINRLWLYLRDMATVPKRSSNASDSRYGYKGAGTGLVLDPIYQTRYLSTLTVLLHSARHSREFLAVLVPETIELVLHLRNVLRLDETAEPLLAAALETILIIIDASWELDGGRTLMGGNVSGGFGGGKGASLLAEVKDWAEKIFEREEVRASRIGRGGSSKAGGAGTNKHGQAAAGILLTIGRIMDVWRNGI